jgi:hypothetical protein
VQGGAPARGRRGGVDPWIPLDEFKKGRIKKSSPIITVIYSQSVNDDPVVFPRERGVDGDREGSFENFFQAVLAFADEVADAGGQGDLQAAFGSALGNFQNFLLEFQIHGLPREDVAGSCAFGAGFGQQRQERFPSAFPGHFHQPQASNGEDFYFRPIVSRGLFQNLHHLDLVAFPAHVDEVDDNDAADVSDAQLFGDLFGRFQVRGGDRLFLRLMADEFPRVHVDGAERFGLLDDDVPAGGKIDPLLSDMSQFPVHAEGLKDRGFARVMLNPLGVFRGQHFHELFDVFVFFPIVDEKNVRVVVQEVTRHLKRQPQFPVNERAGLGGFKFLSQYRPRAFARYFISLRSSFFVGAFGFGADDHAAGQIFFLDDATEPLPFGGFLDVFGHAHVFAFGHVDEVPPGKRDVHRDFHPFGADRLLGDLNHQVFPPFQHFFNVTVFGRADHIGDIEVGVLLEPRVHKRAGDPRENVFQFSLVDVAHQLRHAERGTLDHELRQVAVFQNGDPCFFR